MMDTKKIRAVEILFYKIYNKTASIEERHSYYKLILEDPCAEHVQGLMENQLMRDTEFNHIDSDRKANVYASITQQLKLGQRLRHSFSKYYWTAAAILLLFLFLGIYQYQQVENNYSTIQLEEDIEPGNESATLILADGREIAVSNIYKGEINNNSGIKILNDSLGQLTFIFTGNERPEEGINTIKTKNGQSYKIKLADGTKVWLNAASTIQFSSSLVHSGIRKVRLVGEAYFEVAKDAGHPFVVHTDKQNIHVLGTHFNVSAYPNEQSGATTVLEGRVSVKHQEVEHILSAGEQAITSSKGTIVRKTDSKSVVDWQQGDITLNNVKFDDVMQKIARWYDINIIYEGNIDKTMLTGGWVSKKQPLSAVLRAIQSLEKVRFERKGRTLIVKPY